MLDLWWFTPENNMKESISWLTDVIECRSAETRTKLRTYPRHELSCTFYLKNQDQFSQAKYYIKNTEPIEIDIPWWPYLSIVETIYSTDTVIPIEDPDDYYIEGSRIIITNGSTYSTGEVLSIQVDSITLVAEVGVDYKNAAVMPIETVKSTGFNFSRTDGSSVITASAVFMSEYIKSPSYQPWPLYLNTLIPCIDEQSRVTGAVDENISKQSFVNDNDIGFVSVVNDQMYFRHSQMVQFIPFGYTEKRKIRRFLHWLSGRYNIFYLPTWIDETESDEYTLVRSVADRIEILYSDWDTFAVRMPVIEVNDTVETIS